MKIFMRNLLIALSVLMISDLYYNTLAQKNQTLDDMIADVFNTNTTNDNLPNNGSCTCVPYYKCNAMGGEVIDIRLNETICNSYLEICCAPDQLVQTPAIPKEPKVRRGCGYRNPQGVGFQITGDTDFESQYGEFPWMVAILISEYLENIGQQVNVYRCGGSLIHPKVVLTAAHCVTETEKKFVVRAGEWDTQTKNELYPHQDREVDWVTIHPQYYAGKHYNDIALLFLKSEVEIAPNVDVACLPAQNSNFDNAKCVGSGWGKDIFGKKGRYQVILKRIDLPVVPRVRCQELLQQTRLGSRFELQKSFLCAGGEAGKDTCKGDGGSPLVCPIEGQEDRYQQTGIVAWGIGCGEADTPGVYVNVAMFRKWIDDQLRYNYIDPKSYQF